MATCSAVAGTTQEPCKASYSKRSHTPTLPPYYSTQAISVNLERLVQRGPGWLLTGATTHPEIPHTSWALS